MTETRSAIQLRGAGTVLRLDQARLEVIAGPSQGRELLLGDGPAVLGRSADADLVLDDPAVSRRHAVVEPAGEGYRVRDLGSRSGVFVGDRRVGEAALADGDVLRVGDSEVRVVRGTTELAAPPTEAARLSGLLGASEAMRRLFGLVEKVAPLRLSVLLQGESGTGKEGLARALHELGPDPAGPYEIVDCTLLSEEHLRSELFGHVEGAFTGATGARKGVFERADGGTVFLDEVGEIPPSLQPTLLRVLEQGEVRPLGGTDPISVRVRVISATHRDLAGWIAAGRFRQDLYYRLSGVSLQVPALRDRGEDALLLAEHFLPGGKRLSRWARQAVLEHAWPGNVRQLANVMARAGALARGELVEPRDLGLDRNEAPAAVAAPLADREADAIREALRAARGNRTLAAERLGIARSTLYQKIKKYGLDGEGR